MSRDHTKLRAFSMADELIVPVYRATQTFPSEERYGLQSQIRRAAVSVPTNIVEGSSRKTQRDYLHFLTMAQASAAECGYLFEIARRLEYLSSEDAETLGSRYLDISKALNGLVVTLEKEDTERTKIGAEHRALIAK